jgi:hypothetical protein
MSNDEHFVSGREMIYMEKENIRTYAIGRRINTDKSLCC